MNKKRNIVPLDGVSAHYDAKTDTISIISSDDHFRNNGGFKLKIRPGTREDLSLRSLINAPITGQDIFDRMTAHHYRHDEYSENPHQIPLGIDIHGNVAHWNTEIGHNTMIIGGSTASGKSGIVRSIEKHFRQYSRDVDIVHSLNTVEDFVFSLDESSSLASVDNDFIHTPRLLILEDISPVQMKASSIFSKGREFTEFSRILNEHNVYIVITTHLPQQSTRHKNENFLSFLEELPVSSVVLGREFPVTDFIDPEHMKLVQAKRYRFTAIISHRGFNGPEKLLFRSFVPDNHAGPLYDESTRVHLG